MSLTAGADGWRNVRNRWSWTRKGSNADMVAQGTEAGKPRRKRQHKVRQLLTRPVAFNSCSGPIVVSAEIRRGVPWVQIEAPADVPVTQPAKPVIS